MKLRKLKQEDAPLMLEWMHDPSVVEYMRANFLSKTLEDCQAFIAAAQDTEHDMHLAVVDDDDTYMGTVSLKHITAKDAEFAITVRKAAMGKGFSKYAMQEIIRIGLEELGLEKVYWSVNPKDPRAVRFYEKNGYERAKPEELTVSGYTKEEIDAYAWYQKK